MMKYLSTKKHIVYNDKKCNWQIYCDVLISYKTVTTKHICLMTKMLAKSSNSDKHLKQISINVLVQFRITLSIIGIIK